MDRIIQGHGRAPNTVQKPLIVKSPLPVGEGLGWGPRGSAERLLNRIAAVPLKKNTILPIPNILSIL